MRRVRLPGLSRLPVSNLRRNSHDVCVPETPQADLIAEEYGPRLEDGTLEMRQLGSWMLVTGRNAQPPQLDDR